MPGNFKKGKCVKSCCNRDITDNKKVDIAPHGAACKNIYFWSPLNGHLFKIERFVYVGNRNPGKRAAYAQVILQINKWQLVVLQLSTAQVQFLVCLSKLTKTQDGIMNKDVISCGHISRRNTCLNNQYIAMLVFLWAVKTPKQYGDYIKRSQVFITTVPGPEEIYIQHIHVHETFQPVTPTYANKRPQHYHVGVSGNWYRLCTKLRPSKAFINYRVGSIYLAWIIHTCRSVQIT